MIGGLRAKKNPNRPLSSMGGCWTRSFFAIVVAILLLVTTTLLLTGGGHHQRRALRLGNMTDNNIINAALLDVGKWTDSWNDDSWNDDSDYDEGEDNDEALIAEKDLGVEDEEDYGQGDSEDADEGNEDENASEGDVDADDDDKDNDENSGADAEETQGEPAEEGIDSAGDWRHEQAERWLEQAERWHEQAERWRSLDFDSSGSHPTGDEDEDDIEGDVGDDALITEKDLGLVYGDGQADVEPQDDDEEDVADAHDGVKDVGETPSAADAAVTDADTQTAANPLSQGPAVAAVA